jgi:hypothetical protein
MNAMPGALSGFRMIRLPTGGVSCYGSLSRTPAGGSVKTVSFTGPFMTRSPACDMDGIEDATQWQGGCL